MQCMAHCKWYILIIIIIVLDFVVTVILLMEVYMSSFLASLWDPAPNANSAFCLIEQKLLKSEWETLKYCIRLLS